MAEENDLPVATNAKHGLPQLAGIALDVQRVAAHQIERARKFRRHQLDGEMQGLAQVHFQPQSQRHGPHPVRLEEKDLMARHGQISQKSGENIWEFPPGLAMCDDDQPAAARTGMQDAER
ncbi:hypothetical protein [Roseibium aestuarii]|uniref:Uncharacterized protein n=1 Tax=Roseibium aestuarii TaxID=2600299 RepID=A0ABW4JX35_9HYPH|nr:hypothetical protein [Roseibium aestuarii]